MTKTEYILQHHEPNGLVQEPQGLFHFPIRPLANPNRQKSVLSLFSGCGGMDLGFEGHFLVHAQSLNHKTHPHYTEKTTDQSWVKLAPTIFQLVFANDILRDARTAWTHHFGKLGYDEEIFHSESIVDLVKLHQSGVPIFPENVDVVTGGFPCQDFSIAGKRKGFDSHKDHHGNLIDVDIASEETRGKLYYWMKQVIEITKPKIFIAENVKGLVNLANVKEIIQHDFAEADGNGYIVLDPQVLHAADYGVPQSRERVIFIGIRKSALNPYALAALTNPQIPPAYNPYPTPSHNYNNRNPHLPPAQTLQNIFALLVEPDQSQDPAQQTYSKAKFMGVHCQGQTEVNMAGISPTIRAEHHGNIEYRRLSAENGGTNHAELAAGLPERRLTPRECALIQTFPPDYEFVIPKLHTKNKYILSPSGAYKVIGNAVPPLLAYHLAKRLEQVWELYFKETNLERVPEKPAYELALA